MFKDEEEARGQKDMKKVRRMKGRRLNCCYVLSLWYRDLGRGEGWGMALCFWGERGKRRR